MKKHFFIYLIFCGVPSLAQTGGGYSYQFLNLPANARVAALGGVNVSHGEPDVHLFGNNPALLSPHQNKLLGFSSLGLLGETRQSTVSFVNDFEKLGPLGLQVQYLNHGTIESYDATGQSMGEFDASEYAISLGHSRTSGNFTAGASLKLASSRLSTFRSTALLADIGLVFRHPEKELTIGMAIKNVGFLIADFSEQSQTNLPTDLQLGLTFKPQHMPFRFSLTTYRWLNSRPLYQSPLATTDSPNMLDQALSHVVLGTELVLNKNFQLRFGYNHQVRQELRLPEVSGGAGFSFGLMVKIKAFELAYSRSAYNPAGAGNHLGITTDFKKIFKKKTILEN